MRKQREIWFLLDTSGFGGIESHVLQLTRSLNETGLSVRVVIMKDYGNSSLINALESEHIKTCVSGSLKSLIRMIKNKQPAIIHTHGYKAGIVGRVLGRYLNVKIVSTFHAGEIPAGKVAFYDWLDRKLARLSDHNFCVSTLIAKRLNTYSEVIENFIDTKTASFSNGSNIAFVGRLSKEKGPDTFIELAKKNSSQNFHIYGSGPMENELTAVAPKNLVFHGHQNSMNEVWSEIGLLIICSRFEGLPMVAIEAMARGIPVIAYDVGDLFKLIDHGKNGWIVKQGDIEKYQERIQSWNNMSEDMKLSFKYSAVSKVNLKYSADAVLPKYVSRYTQIEQSVYPGESKAFNLEPNLNVTPKN